jgi:hypothetical protein
MRIHYCHILLLISLCIVILFAVPAQLAQAEVQVGGVIFTDTTWTAGNSPYIITQDINVASDAVLTIEPGVEVRFRAGKSLYILGTLVARGAPDLPVVFTSDSVSPAPGDWGSVSFYDDASPTRLDTDGEYLGGSILQYCIVEYGGANTNSTITAYSHWIDHCTIRHNAARAVSIQGSNDHPGRLTSSILVDNLSFAEGGAGVLASFAQITGNRIQDNSAPYGNGGGILAENSTLQANQVIHNGALNGGGIYLSNGVMDGNTVLQNTAQTSGGVFVQDSEVFNNWIVRNSGRYSGGMLAIHSQNYANSLIDNQASVSASAATVAGGSFKNNTVIGNRVAEDARGSGLFLRESSEMTGNTLYDNLPYEISTDAGENITATQNLWGISPTADIPTLIYDQEDDPHLGRIVFQPAASNPNPEAPPAPPVHLSLDVHGSRLKLTWETLPFTTQDLNFRVYSDQNGANQPNNLETTNETSLLETVDQEFLVLDGIEPNQDYYFYVTALDSAGRESWHSNEVHKMAMSFIYLPMTQGRE